MDKSQKITGERKRVVVGVSDMHVSDDPDTLIITHSLGPCIGVIVFDPIIRTGGLLHFQLPTFQGHEERAKERPYMFADVAIPLLLKDLYRKGSNFNQLGVSIFGGASMMLDETIFKIGIQNARAAKKILWQNSLKIRHEDVGGNSSRTVSIEIKSGLIGLQKDGKIFTFT